MLSLILTAGLLTQIDVQALRETPSEPHQTDDPAIWVNPKKPAESLIFGTIKMAAPNGAVAVYRLDGSRLQRIPNIDRPNNIDVAYGLVIGNRKVDVAVVTERLKNQLRVFEIVPGVGLKDLAALPVFDQPMGIGLYTRRSDKALFAIISRKTGPSGSYLWQYRISADKTGKLTAVKVREFGTFSGSKEIEAVAIDPEREHVYYSDEGAGIRKYHADPAHRDAAKELGLFGTTGWTGDREGIAIHGSYVVATDQKPLNSEFHVFARDTLKELGVFRVGADTTDGIDISSNGIFVAMNDKKHNFILAEWKTIAAALQLK